MADGRIPVRILLIWLLLVLYVTLHEGGHALAALCFGSDITYFSINLLDARMHFVGALSEVQSAIVHIAGFGLPFIIWLMFMWFAPARSENRILEYAKVYSIMVMGTVIPWMIIPLLYLYGKAPAGDDVTMFLNTSSIHPLALTIMSFTLLAGSLLLWRRKTGDLVRIIRLKDSPYKVGRSTFAAMILLSVMAFPLMSFPLVGKSGMKSGAGELVCEIDISQLPGMMHELATIHVEGDKDQPFEIHFRDASAASLHLKLAGSQGDTISLFGVENFSAGSYSQSGSVNMLTGSYSLLLQKEQAKGHMKVFLKR